MKTPSEHCSLDMLVQGVINCYGNLYHLENEGVGSV